MVSDVKLHQNGALERHACIMAYAMTMAVVLTAHAHLSIQDQVASSTMMHVKKTSARMEQRVKILEKNSSASALQDLQDLYVRVTFLIACQTPVHQQLSALTSQMHFIASVRLITLERTAENVRYNFFLN